MQLDTPTLNTLRELVKSAGSVEGDRTALADQRTGVRYDDWPGLSFAEDQVKRIVWREGADWLGFSSDEKAKLVCDFVDCYRSGYAAAWRD